jgi:hypothetical protein
MNHTRLIVITVGFTIGFAAVGARKRHRERGASG